MPVNLLWGDDVGLPSAGAHRLKGIVACGLVRSDENVRSLWRVAVRLSQPLGGDGRERLGLGQVKDEEKDVGVGVRHLPGSLVVFLWTEDKKGDGAQQGRMAFGP